MSKRKLSVGLGRIGNDPQATPLTRKALGILSSPDLLVSNTGVSIDDEGRFILQLKDGGGLSQDENGVYLTAVEKSFGIDSEVNLVSDEYDRDWNMNITGTAPNYIQSRMVIGTNSELSPEVFGFALNEIPEVDRPMVSITETGVQLKLAHDQANATFFKTFPNGFHEIYSVGTRPGFQLLSIDTDTLSISGGFRLNLGTEIQQIKRLFGEATHAGGGVLGAVSWEEVYFSFSLPFALRPDQDHVSACPAGAGPMPAQIIGWSARLSTTNQVAVRIAWFDVLASFTREWILLIHRMPTLEEES